MSVRTCKICGATLCSRNPHDVCCCHKQHPDYNGVYFAKLGAGDRPGHQAFKKVWIDYQGDERQ